MIQNTHYSQFKRGRLYFGSQFVLASTHSQMSPRQTAGMAERHHTAETARTGPVESRIGDPSFPLYSIQATLIVGATHIWSEAVFSKLI